MTHLNRRDFLGTAAALALAGCRSGPQTGRDTDDRRAQKSPRPSPTRGPLRRHPANPRYFADARGRVVYLTGAHTWPNLVDQGLTDPPAAFDFGGYLDFLSRHGHNFIRLWTWESTVSDIDEGGRRMRYYASPQPWHRTGPGLALDGKPRFDLSRFEPAYFERLRARVAAAGRRGIYVSIMLFEGWAMQHAHGAYEGHPFHPANNVNGVKGDLNADGKGLEIHTLMNSVTLPVQESYVRQVIDSVGDLDNVLYEISNENHPPSTEWQYHFLRFIRSVEERQGQVHPVGMTFQYKGGRNQVLFESPADWISPNPEGGYRDDPPVADGRKVILNDTDHLWGIGGTPDWAWKSFLRGHHVLFMDPYDGVTFGAGNPSKWEPIRRALGQTRAWAEKVDLARMIPRPELCSTGYCLADVGGPRPELLAYSPKPGPVSLDLRSVTRRLNGEWFDPESGQLYRLPSAEPGAWWASPPLGVGPALVHLWA
jgi:hypothetical protein